MHCRQKLANQASTSDVTAAVSFADVLVACPRVLQLMSMESKQSLAASCRSMRKLIHSHITMLTLADESDFRLLLKSSWPRLGLIVVKELPPTFSYKYELYRVILNPQWQILACIQVCASAQPERLVKQDHALLIKPVHTNWRKHAQSVMQPLEHLLSVKWQSSANLPSNILVSANLVYKY